jgi:hypothetical protein
MMINMRTLMRGIGAAAAVLAIGFLAAQPAEAVSVRTQPNGAIRFYDDQGGDRGYEWCLQGGGSGLGIPVCDYYTEAQCRASLVNVGFCVRNPWSDKVQLPPQRLRLQ